MYASFIPRRGLLFGSKIGLSIYKKCVSAYFIINDALQKVEKFPVENPRFPLLNNDFKKLTAETICGEKVNHRKNHQFNNHGDPRFPWLIV